MAVQKNKPALPSQHPPADSSNADASRAQGLRFQPYFVAQDADPYQQVKWVRRSSQITDPKGKVVFSAEAVEVPETWSQLATDIAVSKYFRKAGVPGTGHETSVRQLVHRVAHTIRVAGEEAKNYFASSQDAEQFEKELVHILLMQKGAFNSPVWFNCGLYHEYGIQGSGGSFAWDFTLNQPAETKNSYQRPQCSACFIQSVDDDLMSIFDLVKNEARIFKFGSGTGTNFSKIRGSTEKLSSGGTSSGLMSFLEVLDRGAGATKSGGTTRRAAKMVCLDLDHPEIVDFINWKSREEKKVAALVAAGYSSDFNGEAYKTVGGQNSNNSVRINDAFMQALERDGDWRTTARTNGETVATFKARELWQMIAQAAWECADPGVQFDSTIQKWHTCAESGRINGSNPCSEYMFLDDSACNLASLNLLKFVGDDGRLDVKAYRHASRVLFVAQDILVDLSSYPTKEIARNSHDFRPLGLGFANLGTMLMVLGIPYDSPAALSWAGVVTALMHGEAYRTSAELARAKGPFAAYAKNAKTMLRVIKQHQTAAQQINFNYLPSELKDECQSLWREVEKLAGDYGFRNAQATVLAPTGTIGLLMDCDTTGIEPDFALVKFKKLAGGGFFKIVNQSVPKALRALGYTEKQISDIVRYAVGTMELENAPYINSDSLRKCGFNDVDLAKISAALPAAFDLNSVITPWVVGDAGLARVGVHASDLERSENSEPRSLLEELGFSPEQIRAASEVVCGRMMLEGAPYLREEHLAVFDCANKCGLDGTRFITPLAHIRMMAAAQPFLSGAISKTVNLPYESTVEEIKQIYYDAWRMGVKAVAVYRDGSKVSQVLSGGAKRPAEDQPRTYTQAELEEAVQQAIALAPPRKRKMPPRRKGLTIEARVSGHKIFLRTGEYDDGRLGEIFIDMHKEGATLRSLLNCFAISVSMGLQYGVPLEAYVEKFTFTRFEPHGLVDHPNIKTATSILDYVFRVLGMEYLGKTDFVHVKPALDDLAVYQTNDARPGHESVAEGERLDSVQLGLPMEKAAIPRVTTPSVIDEKPGSAEPSKQLSDPLDMQFSALMGDAPMCSVCGHVTVRNGSCYRCLNCGNSMGCS